VDEVKQWTWEPFLFNGNPVRVWDKNDNQLRSGRFASIQVTTLPQ
jgi:hypothetical protein